MRVFAATMENLSDVIRDGERFSTIVLSTTAGMTAAALYTQGTDMGAIVLAEGLAIYTAYRIAPVVVERISRIFRKEAPMPELPDSVKTYLSTLDMWEPVAVASLEGKWLVRDDATGRSRTMDKAEFARFEADVAARGGVLHKITVDGDAVRMSRLAGGKLEGFLPETPAIIVFRDDGRTDRVYAHQGQRIGAERVVWPKSIEALSPETFKDLSDALHAKANACHMRLHGGRPRPSEGSVVVELDHAVGGYFRSGDISVARPVSGDRPGETQYVAYSTRIGVEVIVPPGTLRTVTPSTGCREADAPDRVPGR